MYSVLFFDGVCGLCNRFVNFLIRRNHRNQLRFATLQGESAQQLLPKEFREDINTLVFWQGNRALTKSTGALRAIATLGGVWQVFAIFLIVPPFIRNWVYNIVVENRYKWFGKSETCRLPTPEEKEFFLR